MKSALFLAIFLCLWIISDGNDSQEASQFQRYLRLWAFPDRVFLNHTMGCIERHYAIADWDEAGPPRGCAHSTHLFLHYYAVNGRNQSDHRYVVDGIPTPGHFSLHAWISSLHSGTSPANITAQYLAPVNCKYNVEMTTAPQQAAVLHPHFRHLQKVLAFHLLIHQQNCKMNSAWSSGGSSFAILSKHPLVHVDCVWTSFTQRPEQQRPQGAGQPEQQEQYLFSCITWFDWYSHEAYQANPKHSYYTNEQLTIPEGQLSDGRLCFSLLVLLEYESYRAYSEINTSLGESIFDERVCFTVPQASTRALPAAERRMDSYSALDSTFAEVQASLASHPMFLVGSSHMRYLWDELVFHYFNGKADLLQLPAHHADEVIDGTQFNYYRNQFFWTMSNVLEAFCQGIEANISRALNASTGRSQWWETHAYDTAARSVERITVVLQSGAWDHQFNPPRGVLHHIHHFVDKLTAIASRPCSMFMDIHVLTTVPLPLCGYSHSTYGQIYPGLKGCGDRGFRNNHAMRALAQVLTDSVRKIQYPGPIVAAWAGNKAAARRKLKVVDVFALMHPFHAKAVCGVHYTCALRKPQDVLIVNTTAGMVGRNALLSSLMGLS